MIHEPGPDNYGWARNQVRQILGGDIVFISAYQSVILYKVPMNPHEAANIIRERLRGTSTPIIRVIPVDYVTNPIIDEVIEAVKKLVPKIGNNETFRITLEGHLMKVNEDGSLVRMHTIDAIREIAKFVNRKVDLKNPSWVIYIRVVRYMKVNRKATVSLVKPEEIARII